MQAVLGRELAKPKSKRPWSEVKADLQAEYATRTWFVVVTEPRHERIAASQLVARRIAAYLPEMEVRRLSGRKMRPFVVPILPRYVLVRIDPDDATTDIFDRIRSTLGVLPSRPWLTGPNGAPAAIPEKAVDIIRQCEEQKAKRASKNASEFKVGQEVEIIDGPFAWLRAVIEDISLLDTKGRIKAGMDLFGRLTSAEFEASQIRAA